VTSSGGPAIDFDVAVVGAGPAGSVAAYRLAKAGLSVVQIERGVTPGSKNVSGGVLYGRVLDDLLPGYANEAPVERKITRHAAMLMTKDSAVALDYSSRLLAEPVNAVTVLRANFDPWLAAKAEEAGAFLMTGVRVDSLLTEPGLSGAPTVVGLRAGDDELRTRVVIAADGVNSFLGRSVGLTTKPPTNQLGIGIKAVVGLPRRAIEDRFALADDEGAAFALVGDCTLGVGGGGFLYTNTESLSLGVVLRLDDLLRSARVRLPPHRRGRLRHGRPAGHEWHARRRRGSRTDHQQRTGRARHGPCHRLRHRRRRRRGGSHRQG
jgi:electron transfer flavoprotein-quinone oxidoreductase